MIPSGSKCYECNLKDQPLYQKIYYMKRFCKYLHEECKQVAGGNEQQILLSVILLTVFLPPDPNLNFLLKQPCPHHV